MAGTDTASVPAVDTPRGVLRHLTATLAYRAAKVLRDAPPPFAAAPAEGRGRAPVQIVAHLGDLIDWAITLARGDYVWQAGGGADWDREVARFFDRLQVLDEELVRNELAPDSIRKLIQGPLADALTHVGQLSLLRGRAGAPVRPESYARADIVAGRVGLDQAPPESEFDGDASGRARVQ
jgi:hypothetical protein